MSLKAMYNQVAESYANANRFGAISRSHSIAIDQIKKFFIDQQKLHYKILDLGVGDGAFLKSLHQLLPQAEYTGIDLSPEMLKRAARALPIKTIEGTATEASKLLPPHSQDLVLAHFINAYIPIHPLFNEAHTMARANGYFSMITTTYDSFPFAQQQLAKFIAQDNFLSSIVGHYYKSVVKNTSVAVSSTELLATFAEHQFEIVEHKRLEIPITFQNTDELAQFGIDGAWFINVLTSSILPNAFLIQRLKRLFNRIFTFPYQDTHVIDIVLAKK
jgi:ubiquinone/menaquinone biosynthesis C-methylase UbiE